ncbi:MAG: hypothetical protein RBR82_15155 [Pseudomonas sp.]|nr:hypothetical protein [Pseudomonas sp.]
MTKKEYKDLLERYKIRTQEINRATIESIVKETPAAQEARIARLLKPDNYGEFFNYYFGMDTPIPLADSDCAWFHKDVYKDLYSQPFITLFNLIYRGGAKSTHANLGYPFALKQSKLAKFFLTVGANELRAMMLLQDMQVQFEANNRIIKDFGLQKAYGSWAEGQFQTTDRCNFMALGIDQPFRGLRANGNRLDYTSIDDIEDKKRALNTSLVNEYADKVTGDIQGAFGKKSERTIINNNYFVEKGFIAALLKKKGFNFKKVDTRKNQVITEKYSKVYLVNLTTKYYSEIEANPDSPHWKPSWEERVSRADCLRKIEQYKNDRATLSNEFYNTPIKVGKRIKESMIRMVKPKPFSAYLCIIGNWDLAYSTTACYKALATLGVSDYGLTVIDLFCRQSASIDEAMEYHYKRANQIIKLNGAVLFYYDASVAQEAVYSQTILRAARKHKSCVIPLPQKSTTDKYTKIDTVLVGALLSGVLDFSEDLDKNPDWGEAKEQLLNFEKGSKFPVDFPDALADAILQAQGYISMGEDEDTKPTFGKRKIGGY